MNEIYILKVRLAGGPVESTVNIGETFTSVSEAALYADQEISKWTTAIEWSVMQICSMDGFNVVELVHGPIPVRHVI